MSVHYHPDPDAVSYSKPESATLKRIANHCHACDTCNEIYELVLRIRQMADRRYQVNAGNTNGLRLLEWRLINLIERRFYAEDHGEPMPNKNGTLKFTSHVLQEAYYILNPDK